MIEPPPVVKHPPVIAEQAVLLVWVEVYSCFQALPRLSDFEANQDAKGDWIVEGKAEDASYGLWKVKALTGTVSALDLVARQAVAGICSPSQAVLTSEQASLRVWIATYRCFTPPLLFSVFEGKQVRPQEWIVEGRAGASLYGLWLVDADTAEIIPWDALAQTVFAQPCFQEP